MNSSGFASASARSRRSARISRCSARISFFTQSAPSDLTEPRTNKRASYSESPSASPASPQHNQVARLRHEGAHVTDVAMHHDVDRPSSKCRSGGSIALDHQQPAATSRPGILAGVAFDDDRAGHHVFSRHPALPSRGYAPSPACSCRRSNSRWSRAHSLQWAHPDPRQSRDCPSR